MSLELVLITGMSGSGKSVALRALEDAGYFCVDNLPPELLLSFVDLEQRNARRRVAIAMDVRTATSLPQVPGQLRELVQRGVPSGRCSSTPRPKPWCGASPKPAAATRSPRPPTPGPTSSARWWRRSNSSASCSPSCANTRT